MKRFTVWTLALIGAMACLDGSVMARTLRINGFGSVTHTMAGFDVADTIGDVKARILAKTGMPVSEQKLTHGTVILDDGETLGSAGISDNAEIDLECISGGSVEDLTVVTRFTPSVFSVGQAAGIHFTVRNDGTAGMPFRIDYKMERDGASGTVQYPKGSVTRAYLAGGASVELDVPSFYPGTETTYGFSGTLRVPGGETGLANQPVEARTSILHNSNFFFGDRFVTTDVPEWGVFEFRFTEALDGTTATDASIRLVKNTTGGADVDVAKRIRLTEGNRLLTVIPANPLETGADYTLSLDSDLTSTDGNRLEADRAFSFATFAENTDSDGDGAPDRTDSYLDEDAGNNKTVAGLFTCDFRNTATLRLKADDAVVLKNVASVSALGSDPLLAARPDDTKYAFRHGMISFRAEGLPEAASIISVVLENSRTIPEGARVYALKADNSLKDITDIKRLGIGEDGNFFNAVSFSLTNGGEFDHEAGDTSVLDAVIGIAFPVSSLLESVNVESDGEGGALGKGFPLYGKIEAVFSKPMDWQTVENKENFHVCEKETGARIPAKAVYTGDPRKISLFPDAPLKAGTNYVLFLGSRLAARNSTLLTDQLGSDMTFEFRTASERVDTDGNGIMDGFEAEGSTEKKPRVLSKTRKEASFGIDMNEFPSGAKLADVKTFDAKSPGTEPVPPSGLVFPDGLLSYTVTGLGSGESLVVPIELSADFPANGRVYKADRNGVYRDITDRCRISGKVVEVTIVDGDAFDLDPVDGVIKDPIGIAVPASTSGDSGGSGGGGCFLVELI